MIDVEDAFAEGIFSKLRSRDSLKLREVLERLVHRVDATYASVSYVGRLLEYSGDARTSPDETPTVGIKEPFVVPEARCRDGFRRAVGVGKVRLLRRLPTGVVLVVGPELGDETVVAELSDAIRKVERILAAVHDR